MEFNTEMKNTASELLLFQIHSNLMKNFQQDDDFAFQLNVNFMLTIRHICQTFIYYVYTLCKCKKTTELENVMVMAFYIFLPPSFNRCTFEHDHPWCGCLCNNVFHPFAFEISQQHSH